MDSSFGDILGSKHYNFFYIAGFLFLPEAFILSCGEMLGVNFLSVGANCAVIFFYLFEKFDFPLGYISSR